jgi:hypothetical protein
MARGGAGAVASTLRSHWLFLAFFAGGAALRIVVTIAYQPALLLQMDAHSYLRRAVELDLSAGVFRPMIYPILIRPLIDLGGLALVPVVQHVTGLGIALLLYLLLNRLGCPPSLAALGTVPILFDGYQLNVEHYVLAETFFEAMIVGSLTLIAWTTRPPIVSVGVSGLLLALAGLTRYVGAALIVPVVVYMLVRRMGFARVATMLVAFALPLAAYASWSRESSGSFGVTSKNGFFLYGRVASFADCTRFEPPRGLHRFCFEVPPAERPVSRGIWGLEPELTGFDVRKLFHRPGANARLQEFSLAAIRGQPFDYGVAVAQDTWRFFSPQPAETKEPNVRTWRFPRELADADPHPFVVRNRGSAPEDMGFAPFEINRPLATFLRSYQSVVYASGGALIVLLVLGVAGAIVGPPGAHTHRGMRAEGFLFLAAALALLLGAVMTTVYHFRYVLPAVPLLGASAAIGATAVALRARSLSGGLAHALEPQANREPATATGAARPSWVSPKPKPKPKD